MNWPAILLVVLVGGALWLGAIQPPTWWSRRRTRAADYAKREAEIRAMCRPMPDPTRDRHEAFPSSIFGRPSRNLGTADAPSRPPVTCGVNYYPGQEREALRQVELMAESLRREIRAQSRGVV